MEIEQTPKVESADSNILSTENLPVVTMTEEVAPIEQEVKPETTPQQQQQQQQQQTQDESEPVSIEDFFKVKVENFEKPSTEIKQELPKTRDYSGLSEEDVPLFKQMSNEAFAKLKPAYLERASLKSELEKVKAAPKQSTIPESYLEHEDAITLLPEYKAGVQKVQLAEAIVQHWENQLANIRRGKEWKGLVVDEKTGVISVEDKPRLADAASEAAVNRYLTLTANQQYRVQEQFNKYVDEFKAKRGTAVSFIAEQEKKYFSAFDDEKHPARPIIEEVKNKLPAEFRNSPLVPLLAKSLVACLFLEKKVLELQNSQQKRTATISDARKAGPTMSSINGAAVGANESEVAFDDFLKAKQSY